jgi:hypothetical protein
MSLPGGPNSKPLDAATHRSTEALTRINIGSINKVHIN